MKSILIALCLIVLPAQAQQFFNLWHQPQGTESRLTVPMYGGTVYIPDKRPAGATQFVHFEFDARDYWSQYPEDHVYIALDATLSGGKHGRTGRGVTLNRDGIGFENFGLGEMTAFHPAKLDDNRYALYVYVSDGFVSWVLYDVETYIPITFDFIAMQDETPKADKSLIVMGATSECTGTLVPRVPKDVLIRNVTWGMYRPLTLTPNPIGK